MKRDETHRNHTLIGVLGITVLVFLMLGSIADAEPFAYIANLNSDTVSVIDTAANSVINTINVGIGPQGIAVNSDGTKVYVTNSGRGYYTDSTVSVIDTATNTVTATVNVGSMPTRVAVTPDGKKYMCRTLAALPYL